MSWEVLDHTADIGIQAFGATVEEAFAEAARGMLRLIAPALEPRPDCRKAVTIPGLDLEALLVAWLSEIIYLLYAEGFFPAGIDALSIGREQRGDGAPGGSGRLVLRADLAGEVLSGERRSELQLEIKAATYHMLEVKEIDHSSLGKAWRLQVIFDI